MWNIGDDGPSETISQYLSGITEENYERRYKSQSSDQDGTRYLQHMKQEYKSRRKEKNIWGKARGALYLRGKKEHLVRRYPGNARSSF
jgi:hypothetical protein